ncbi:hypothetical protein HQ447_04600 [bacterium]|nr:hypothetical protein [bacterium]
MKPATQIQSGIGWTKKSSIRQSPAAEQENLTTAQLKILKSIIETEFP